MVLYMDPKQGELEKPNMASDGCERQELVLRQGDEVHVWRRRRVGLQPN